MSAPPPTPIKVLGLQVERKTDFLALAAFLIALTTAGIQVRDHLEGAQMTFFGPERAYLYPVKDGDGVYRMRISAPMSYTNSAGKEFSGVLRAETADVALDGRTWRLLGDGFGDIESSAEGFPLEKHSGGTPVPIEGGSALGHWTFFSNVPRICRAQGKLPAPCEVQDYLTFDFLQGRLRPGTRLSLTFTAYLSKGGSDERQVHWRCDLVLTQASFLTWGQRHYLGGPCIH